MYICWPKKLQVPDSRQFFGQGFRRDERKIGSKKQKCIYAGRKNYKSQIADNFSARASAGINEKNGSKNQKCIYAGRKNYKSQIADNFSARASTGMNEKLVLKIKNVYMLAEKITSPR
jgi:hypothetical protein